jgi:hypothetical protein
MRDNNRFALIMLAGVVVVFMIVFVATVWR